MKKWAKNLPGLPGGSDFKTDDIDMGPPLSEEVLDSARSYVKRLARDATDAQNLLDALGLQDAAE